MCWFMYDVLCKINTRGKSALNIDIGIYRKEWIGNETLSIDTGPWTQYLLLFGFSRGTLYNMGNLGPEIYEKGKQEWIKDIVRLTFFTLTPFMCIFFRSTNMWYKLCFYRKLLQLQKYELEILAYLLIILHKWWKKYFI